MSQKTDAPLDTYEVNSSTIAVLPEPMNGKMYSKIIEKDCTFYVSMKPLQIVDRSCRYFGSSYAGRKAGTYEVINISHKPPIMVDLTISFYSLHFLQQDPNAAGYHTCM